MIRSLTKCRLQGKERKEGRGGEGGRGGGGESEEQGGRETEDSVDGTGEAHDEEGVRDGHY